MVQKEKDSGGHSVPSLKHLLKVIQLLCHRQRCTTLCSYIILLLFSSLFECCTYLSLIFSVLCVVLYLLCCCNIIYLTGFIANIMSVLPSTSVTIHRDITTAITFFTVINLFNIMSFSLGIDSGSDQILVIMLKHFYV